MKKSLILGSLVSSVALFAQPIEIQDIGSFHIGGRAVTLDNLPVKEIQVVANGPIRKSNPNGDYEVEQMYVQYVKLANPRALYPLLMWHGGGLSGVTWENKPDGKSGWQNFFLKQGHSTYVSDAVERGRASWAQYPNIWSDEPEHRTKNSAWSAFRIGDASGYNTDPKKRVAYENQQFPIDSFDQFTKQFVARWVSSGAATQKAYNEYVEKVGDCVLLVHSQASSFVYNTALAHPNSVKAIIAIEPSGAPDPVKVDLEKIKKIPHLVVWGDFYDKSPIWQKYRSSVEKYLEAFEKVGGKVTVIDLPKMGIKGNSHMLMMDKNSDQIAQMVQDWMKNQALMK